MRVRMNSTAAHPVYGTHTAGQVCDLPEHYGADLVRGGWAEAVAPAAAVPPETDSPDLGDGAGPGAGPPADPAPPAPSPAAIPPRPHKRK